MNDRTANILQPLFPIRSRPDSSTKDLSGYQLGQNGQRRKPFRMLRSLGSCSSKVSLPRCRSLYSRIESDDCNSVTTSASPVLLTGCSHGQQSSVTTFKTPHIVWPWCWDISFLNNWPSQLTDVCVKLHSLVLLSKKSFVLSIMWTSLRSGWSTTFHRWSFIKQPFLLHFFFQTPSYPFSLLLCDLEKESDCRVLKPT